MNAFDPTFQYLPILIEIVTEIDALDDLTAATDLHHGLTPDCDTHLLWLSNDSNEDQSRRNSHRLWKNDPKLPGELQTLFESLQPDIVHTHRFEELITVGHAARQSGISQIVHSVCGEVTGAENCQLEQFTAVVGELSPLLIAPSEEAAERLPASAQIEILPAGVDCERYAPGDQARARRKVGLPGEARIIGCASPLHGLEALLHSMFRMDGTVHLALFGQSRPTREQRLLINRLGLDERVHVLGAWARPELIFQAIDIYYHGPSGDCLPRAVLAAQACGKATIACSPTASRTLCPQTGRLTPTQYIPTLLHSLQRTLDSSEPELTRQFILDNWNTAQSLEGYARLFHRITERNPQQRLPA
ncbi:MAG: glycosyltransferase family 4 protein [Proteobacteria bacterium]|nr:glycosyltransferase family 4 protein [Pseudomonadota bacterium]